MAKRHALQHSPLTRERIKVGMLIKRLSDHVEGKCELTATQVRAAEVLLRKKMPDLSTSHIEGQVIHSFVDFIRAVNAGPTLDAIGHQPLADLPQVAEEVRH